MVGLLTLYSASGESFARVGAQFANIAVAFAIMWIAANIPPHYLLRLALPVYLVGLILLVAVALFGEIVNGARRWLHIGVTRIQPSELMKIAVPLALAWYFDRYEAILKLRDYAIAAVMVPGAGAPGGQAARSGHRAADRVRRLLRDLSGRA